MHDTSTPPPIFDELEVAQMLRLDRKHDAEQEQREAVRRLVRSHGLRPIVGLKPYRFAGFEIEDWMRRQTEAWDASESQSDAEPAARTRNGGATA